MGKGIVVFFSLIALLFAAAIYSAIAESRQWDEFKVSHACKITARVTGDTFNTFSVGANGQVAVGVGSTPDKTGWTCDDGITYFR